MKESLRATHVKHNVLRVYSLEVDYDVKMIGIVSPLSAGSIFQELLVLRLLYTEVLVVSYRPPNQTTLGVQGDKVFLFR